MSDFPDYKRAEVSDLIPYARNARTHSDEQVDKIAASIREFGFLNPIITDGDNGIVAGHGRIMAAKKLGIDEVPTIEAAHLTDAQKRAYILADNRLALDAGWDDEMLRVELDELGELGFDLELTGFSLDELASIYDEPDFEPGDEDAVPEEPETPVTVEGDIWVLGNHRLMCGDSTSADAVERLLAETKIDLVHTDPPYGINEKCDREFASRTRLAKGNKFKQIKGDETTDTAVDAFNLVQGLGVARQVWWGANYYAHAVPQTANWLVWDKRVEEKQTDANSDCELAWVKSKWSSVRIFRHLWKGMIKASEKGQGRIHPTQKPVALAEWVISYYKDVNTLLDLFGGSGFNLIACEKMGVQSFTMEFEPDYCDVIIKRWQDFTGKQAIHEETGKTFDEVANA